MPPAGTHATSPLHATCSCEQVVQTAAGPQQLESAAIQHCQRLICKNPQLKGCTMSPMTKVQQASGSSS